MKKMKEEKCSRVPLSESTGLKHTEQTTKPYSIWQRSLRREGNADTGILGHRDNCHTDRRFGKLLCAIFLKNLWVEYMWMFAASFRSFTWLGGRRYWHRACGDGEDNSVSEYRKLNPWTVTQAGIRHTKTTNQSSGLSFSGEIQNLRWWKWYFYLLKTTFIHFEKCLYASGNLITFINPPTLLSLKTNLRWTFFLFSFVLSAFKRIWCWKRGFQNLQGTHWVIYCWTFPSLSPMEHIYYVFSLCAFTFYISEKSPEMEGSGKLVYLTLHPRRLFNF